MFLSIATATILLTVVEALQQHTALLLNLVAAFMSIVALHDHHDAARGGDSVS